MDTKLRNSTKKCISRYEEHMMSDGKITAIHTLKSINGGQQSFKEYCIDLQDKTVILQ